jgi:uncharacterized membrane protein YidH (DUF202 family)
VKVTRPAVGAGANDQPERTVLAWRRTALSLVAAGAVGGHLVADRVGRLVVGLSLAGLAGVVASCWRSPDRRVAVAGAALVGGVLLLGALSLVAVLGG